MPPQADPAVAILGSVQDRPFEQLRERLRYTGRRMGAYLNVLLTEPWKLGIYPSLCLLLVGTVAGLGSVFILDAVLPGPTLGLGFFPIIIVVLLALLVVAVTVVVALFGLEPIPGRQAWQLTTIQTYAGYAAFRYRLDPDRGGYELVDLWTTNRGAKLGFGRIVPYLVDNLGTSRCTGQRPPPSWPGSTRSTASGQTRPGAAGHCTAGHSGTTASQ